jgi:hypothetical protein
MKEGRAPVHAHDVGSCRKYQAHLAVPSFADATHGQSTCHPQEKGKKCLAKLFLPTILVQLGTTVRLNGTGHENHDPKGQN